MMYRSTARWLPLLFLLALFAFQGAQLDCDPSPIKTFEDFADEGLWQHNARCKALFGSFLIDDVNQDVIASPLFTAFQWMSFSLFGVSIYSARLVCLLSLWLMLAMLYVLVRRESAAGRAILIVALLGLMHETLMYTKWSTPILPEMCFLTAILFFWELGRAGSPWWMVLSGGSLMAAVATKLTAAYFGLSMLLFLAGTYWLRKEVDGRRLLWFGGGVVAGAIPLAPFFALDRRSSSSSCKPSDRASVPRCRLANRWRSCFCATSISFRPAFRSC